MLKLVPLFLSVAVAAAAQGVPQSRAAGSMSTLPTFAARVPDGSQIELTVRLVASGAPAPMATARPAPGATRVEIVRRAIVTDVLVRERNPQIGADELVLVAVDAQGRELAWQHVKDPRIVRSEQPGPDGVLTGQVFYRTDIELVARVPADLGAAILQVYEPQWNGSEYVLWGLTTITVGP